MVLEKLQSFGQIDDFSCFFTKRGTFCFLFPEKFIEMPKHGSLFEKLQSFGQIDDFSCFLHEQSCNAKRQNMVVFRKSCNLRKSMIFGAFSRNEALFATFCLKVHSSQSFGQKFFVLFHMRHFLLFVDRNPKKLQVLAKSMIFRFFEVLFHEMSSPKRQNMVVCWKSCEFSPNRRFFVLFHEMRHFL